MQVSFFNIGLIITIILRIVLFSQPCFKIDMTAWQAWAARLVDLGPTNFYDPNIWTNYTPGYLLILWLIGYLAQFLQVPFFSISFEILIKLVTTLFDIGTAFLIYKIVREKSNSWAKFGSLFYLANPASIFNSSVWGQIDGILSFFMLFAFHSIFNKKQQSYSLPSLAFGLLLKPQALAIFPIYIITLLKTVRPKGMLLGFVLSAILVFITSILFFPKDLFFGLFNLTLQMTKDYPYTSLYAFNLWSIIGWWQSDAATWLNVSYNIWGYLLYIFFLLVIAIPLLIKKEVSLALIFLTAALSLLAFYLFPTRIHERYLFPFFAFFIIFATLRKSIFMYALFVILSLIHFLNLWFVYFYYQYIFENTYFAGNILYDAINKTYRFQSLILILIFGILIVELYRMAFLKDAKEISSA